MGPSASRRAGAVFRTTLPFAVGMQRREAKARSRSRPPPPRSRTPRRRPARHGIPSCGPASGFSARRTSTGSRCLCVAASIAPPSPAAGRARGKADDWPHFVRPSPPRAEHGAVPARSDLPPPSRREISSSQGISSGPAGRPVRGPRGVPGGTTTPARYPVLRASNASGHARPADAPTGGRAPPRARAPVSGPAGGGKRRSASRERRSFRARHLQARIFDRCTAPSRFSVTSLGACNVCIASSVLAIFGKPSWLRVEVARLERHLFRAADGIRSVHRRHFSLRLHSRLAVASDCGTLSATSFRLQTNRNIDYNGGAAATMRRSRRASFLSSCEPRDLISGLVISFSLWQCAGHGDAAGFGFVY